MDSDFWPSISRWLNGKTGGPPDVTFSAWSWELKLRGCRLSGLRVDIVDLICAPFNGMRMDHCLDSWNFKFDREEFVRYRRELAERRLMRSPLDRPSQ